ncbi:MAG: DUF1905 domain-containing protein [Hyphomonadaceae bacterium]|nr:DUF1905 domain-containing protein [Hyphomonadaceae bacterium]
MSARLTFKAKLWRHSGDGAWYFVTLPVSTAQDLRALTRGLRNAFGSLRVIATIGATTWRTALFADSKAASFLLPVKAEVRRRERIGHDDVVDANLEIDL